MKCGNSNFARRGECFKCKEPRPREQLDGGKDPRVERERLLKAAMAMGYDAAMAETIIMDPRFADSVEQFEKMHFPSRFKMLSSISRT